jgi:hypothetical protein
MTPPNNGPPPNNRPIQYQNQSKPRVYDFESIVTASTLVFGFAIGAPLGIWFVLKQLSPNLRAVTIGCLYGYSLFVFIPATVSSSSNYFRVNSI